MMDVIRFLITSFVLVIINGAIEIGIPLLFIYIENIICQYIYTKHEMKEIYKNVKSLQDKIRKKNLSQIPYWEIDHLTYMGEDYKEWKYKFDEKVGRLNGIIGLIYIVLVFIICWYLCYTFNIPLYNNDE